MTAQISKNRSIIYWQIIQEQIIRPALTSNPYDFTTRKVQETFLQPKIYNLLPELPQRNRPRIPQGRRRATIAGSTLCFDRLTHTARPSANMEETLSEVAAMINLCCPGLTASLLRAHVQKMPSCVNGQVRPNLGNCHIFLHYADPFSLATILFMTDICRISGHLSLDLLVASPYI